LNATLKYALHFSLLFYNHFDISWESFKIKTAIGLVLSQKLPVQLAGWAGSFFYTLLVINYVFLQNKINYVALRVFPRQFTYFYQFVSLSDNLATLHP